MIIVSIDAMRTPIRFTGLNRAMALLGMQRRNSWVEVAAGVLRVRMGWWFRATVPLSVVKSAERDTARVFGWGVHGWRGEWLVNGSSSGIVRIAIDPAQRARTCGLRVRLHLLRVSVEDPDELIRSVTAS